MGKSTKQLAFFNSNNNTQEKGGKRTTDLKRLGNHLNQINVWTLFGTWFK